MIDLYIPKSELEAERKLREEAEEQLRKVLEYLDPQPETKGGLIYGAPFPKSGDLARRLLWLVAEWEHDARDDGKENAEYELMLCQHIRETIGEHTDAPTERRLHLARALTDQWERELPTTTEGADVREEMQRMISELRNALEYNPKKTRGGIITPGEPQTVKLTVRPNAVVYVTEVMRRVGAVTSRSLARQYIAQGTVKIDGVVVTDATQGVANPATGGDPFLLTVGKYFERRVELAAVIAEDTAKAPAVCPTCGCSKGATQHLRAHLAQFGDPDPAKATFGMRPVICETCGEMHMEEIL